MVRDHTLIIPGLHVAAKSWGPEHGQPVLAIHGWLDNAASFDGLAPELVGFRVVAVDLPGHGLSEHRAPGATYHFIDWLPDVIAIANALEWPHFTLMGHSLGAAIASMVAGIIPERIKSLILLDGLGPLTSEADDLPQRLRRFLIERDRAAAVHPPVHPTQQAMVDKLLKVTKLSPVAAATLVERGAKQVDGGVTWRADPRLRRTSPLRLTEAQVLTCLHEISCPTLLIHASEGMPYEPEVLNKRLQSIKNLQLVKVDGQHHVHLDEPQKVAPAIREFLQKTM